MALSDIIGRMSAVLGMDTAAFEEGAGIAERRTAQMQRRMEALGDRISSAGRTLTLGLTAPLVAFGVAAGVAASDAAELQSAFDNTFAANAATMNQWAEDTGNALGRSTQEMQKAANTFGIFFNTAVDNDKAAEMSRVFAQLAQDLSSFYNVDAETAIGKLRSALAGESEPIRDFGVFLTEAAVEAKAMELGLAGVGNALTEQEKILARYQLVLEGTTNAQGDVARTSAGTANRVRAMQAAWEELQVTIGQKLLPALTPLIELATRALGVFSRLSPELQVSAVAVAAVAAAAGPLLLVLGPIVANFSKVAGLLALGNPLVLGFAAAGLAIYANWDKIGPILKDVATGLGLIRSEAQLANGELAAQFEAIRAKAVESGVATEAEADRIGAALRRMAQEGGVDTPAAAALTEIVHKMQEAGVIAPVEADKIRAALLDAWGADVAEQNKSGWERLGEDVRVYTSFIIDTLYAWEAEENAVLSNAWRNFDNFTQRLNAFGDSVEAGFENMANRAIEWVNRMADGVRDAIIGRLAGTFTWLHGKLNAAGDAFFTLYDRVVGHSYVPDMVDGIAAQMARLDGEMLAPITRATGAAGEAFRQLQQTAASTLDRLFPEEAAKRVYDAERAAITAALPEGSARDAALRRLAEERDQRRRAGRPAIDIGAEEIEVDIEEVQGALEEFDLETESRTTRIARHFASMAQATTSALSRLAQSIKGGGFFEILDAAIGAIAQIGGSGLFGSKFASIFQKTGTTTVPGFAGGTSFAPGGLALVGERGPELVNLPRGSSVTPNHRLGGGTNVQVIPSPYFDVVVNGHIQRAAPSIAQAGAGVAAQRSAYRNSRRLG